MNKNLKELLKQASRGDAAAIAELLSAAEGETDPSSELIREISSRGGQAHRIAILGVKGSGKSTLIRILSGVLSGYHGEARGVAVNCRSCRGASWLRSSRWYRKSRCSAFPLPHWRSC